MPDPKDHPGGIIPLPDVNLAPNEALMSDVSQSFGHDLRQRLTLGSAEEQLRRREIGLVETEVTELLAKRDIRLDPESDEFFEACHLFPSVLKRTPRPQPICGEKRLKKPLEPVASRMRVHVAQGYKLSLEQIEPRIVIRGLGGLLRR